VSSDKLNFAKYCNVYQSNRAFTNIQRKFIAGKSVGFVIEERINVSTIHMIALLKYFTLDVKITLSCRMHYPSNGIAVPGYIYMCVCMYVCVIVKALPHECMHRGCVERLIQHKVKLIVSQSITSPYSF